MTGFDLPFREGRWDLKISASPNGSVLPLFFPFIIKEKEHKKNWMGYSTRMTDKSEASSSSVRLGQRLRHECRKASQSNESSGRADRLLS